MPTLDGQAAYDALREEISRVNVPSRRLLPISLPVLLPGLLAATAALQAELPLLTASMNEAAQQRFTATLASIEPLAFAGIWLTAQHSRQGEPVRALPPLLAEALPLQRAGFNAMQALALLGLETPEEVRKLQAGRGHMDLAGDLQVMGPRLKERWSILEPLQQHQPDPALRLTEPQLQRMAPLGLAIVQALNAPATPAGGVDWYDALLRCQHLLHERWDTARLTAVGAWAQAGDLARAQTPPPSLLGLFRQG